MMADLMVGWKGTQRVEQWAGDLVVLMVEMMAGSRAESMVVLMVVMMVGESAEK